MNVATFEAVVENGQVRLPATVHLPEKAKVYVIVPGVETSPMFYIATPRLMRKEQSADFAKEVIEELPDAELR
ncbi:MAG: hypothetical protein AB7U82_22540 [Blastocatellales bacterium]